jgi:hypothetical protein
MCPGAADELYITGEHGLAQLRISRDRGAFEWLEVNTDRDRLTHFDYPLPGTGELFAQGISSPGKRHVIVRWSRTRLQSVYDSEADNLRGWRGGDGSVWILEGASIFRLRGGSTPWKGPEFSPAPSSTFIPKEAKHFGWRPRKASRATRHPYGGNQPAWRSSTSRFTR